jgi:putative DNA primase/helicase
MDPNIPVPAGSEPYDEPEAAPYTPPAKPGDFDYNPEETLYKPNGHAQGFVGRHVVYGLPTALWAYKDRSGDVLFFNALYETDEGELCCPWRYDGREWIARAPPPPRMLYGLEQLDPNPEAKILLVDSEAAAEAVRHVISPTVQVALAWYGGPAQAHTATLADCIGRSVTVWPTATDAGRKAGEYMAQTLARCGNPPTSMIDTTGQPQGWNLAQAIQGGWDKAAVLAYARAHKRGVIEDLTVNLVTGKPIERPKPPAVKDADSLIEKLPPFKHEAEIWEYFGLELNANKPWANINNVVRVLKRHPDLWNQLHYDEFRSRVMVGGREWHEENDGGALCLKLQNDLKLNRLTITTVNESVNVYAHTRGTHPVKEWLESRAPWDGEQRLLHLCNKGFGSDDALYEQEVGRCFMVGMIARIYQPGCQVDSMPVFEGRQGIGKTSALNALASPWYAQNTADIRDKDFMQNLSGYWLVEISELDSFYGASMERIKAVISDRNDVYRESYGRRSHSHPRQSVFAGTTNLDTWHHDETGARRFWPVQCRNINLDWIKEMREQLFSEALHRYRAGEDWWKVPDEGARSAQDFRYSEDPWQPIIERLVAGKDETTSEDIFDGLDIAAADRVHYMTTRISKVMRRMGWERAYKRIGGKMARIYRSPLSRS